MLNIKRIYAPASPDDGYRVLVDRLWPRGISKERAQLDLWLKEIAPSTILRKWFAHDVKKWPQFRERYLSELENNRESTDKLVEICKTHDPVTLLYAAKNAQLNEAQIIKEFIDEAM